MKKTLLFAAALAASLAANADVFNYGFGYADNAEFPFISLLNNEDSEFYFPGNYDLVDKYGKAMPNTIALSVLNTPEGADKGVLDLNLAISMLDGQIYKLTPDAVVTDETVDIEEMPAENYNYPFLSWGPQGVTRTIFMPGWGTEDAWTDADYNAAVEADWVATKNGVQFTRLGTQGIVSRGDTYFQYPAVTGKVTVTVWAGSNLGGTANPDNVLQVAVTPVFDGVADPDQAKVISVESPVTKRYYKLESVEFDATGKELAVRVGANNSQLNLMYVSIEGDPVSPEGGIADIIADNDAANSPAFNLLGIQVDENYKGIVIKNGKKFVQK